MMTMIASPRCESGEWPPHQAAWWRAFAGRSRGSCSSGSRGRLAKQRFVLRVIYKRVSRPLPLRVDLWSAGPGGQLFNQGASGSPARQTLSTQYRM